MTDAQLVLVKDESLIVAFHHRSWTFKVRWADGKDVALEGPVMDKGGRWRPGLRDVWEQVVRDHDIPIDLSCPHSQDRKKVVYRFSLRHASGVAYFRFRIFVEADADIKQWRERTKVLARINWLLRKLDLAYKLTPDVLADEVAQLDRLSQARMIHLYIKWQDDFAPFLNKELSWYQWEGKPSMILRYWTDDNIEVERIGLEEVKWVHNHLANVMDRLAEWRHEIEGSLLRWDR